MLELKFCGFAHVKYRSGLLLHQGRSAVVLELIDIETLLGSEADSTGQSAFDKPTFQNMSIAVKSASVRRGFADALSRIG